MDVIEEVRAHYGAVGLTDRLRAALGPGDRPVHSADLASLDQFHTRGLAATEELAELAGISAGMAVLDVGCGIGGPARYLAATFSCNVLGIDISEPFVEAARYLTHRTGQTESVWFEAGSALELPVEDASFDVALLQHVAMNIADRASLYQEIARVLNSGGKFATFDVVSLSGDPIYPLPWARNPSSSFLLSSDETCAAVEHAGFRLLARRDGTDVAKNWFAELQANHSRSPLNLALIMGPDMRELASNLARNVLEGRVGILTALFELAS
jgi:SAM-dependent methyltransferase